MMGLLLNQAENKFLSLQPAATECFGPDIGKIFIAAADCYTSLAWGYDADILAAIEFCRCWCKDAVDDWPGAGMRRLSEPENNGLCSCH